MLSVYVMHFTDPQSPRMSRYDIQRPTTQEPRQLGFQASTGYVARAMPAREWKQDVRGCWSAPNGCLLFLYMGGRSCGCPYNKNPATCGLYWDSLIF